MAVPGFANRGLTRLRRYVESSTLHIGLPAAHFNDTWLLLLGIRHRNVIVITEGFGNFEQTIYWLVPPESVA